MKNVKILTAQEYAVLLVNDYEAFYNVYDELMYKASKPGSSIEQKAMLDALKQLIGALALSTSMLNDQDAKNADFLLDQVIDRYSQIKENYRFL